MDTNPVITPDTGPVPAAPTKLDVPNADVSEGTSTGDAVRDAIEDGRSDAPEATPKTVEPAPKTVPKAKEPDAPKPEAAKPDAAKVEKPAAKAPEAPTEAVPQPDTKAPESTPAKEARPAPERFNEAAKAEWSKAPEAVQHETARAVEEMTAGIEAYRQKYEPLKPYEDMAKQSGVELSAALENYVTAERQLVQDPVRALAQMAEQYAPGGLKGFIGELTGTADPAQQQSAKLEQENARLKAQMEAHENASKEQQAAASRQQQEALVKEFEAANPRLSEDPVRAEMKRLLESQYIPQDIPESEQLAQAYAIAVRLIPETVQTAEPDHTRVEATSLSGARDGGSTPPEVEAMDTSEAVRRALRGR